MPAFSQRASTSCRRFSSTRSETRRFWATRRIVLQTYYISEKKEERGSGGGTFGTSRGAMRSLSSSSRSDVLEVSPQGVHVSADERESVANLPRPAFISRVAAARPTRTRRFALRHWGTRLTCAA